MQDLVEVYVGRPDKDGHYREERVWFIGECIDSYEEGWTRITLYKSRESRHLVHVDVDRPGHDPVRTLYPSSAPSRGYTAEEVAQTWKMFGPAVGIPPEGSYIDY